jgi:hypothetical protein
MPSKSPLKRTDTKSIPVVKSYIKDSKYDKPQKNARKINWDEDDKQQISKIMPPPPPRLVKIHKSNKVSPYPKQLKKKLNSKIVN